MSIGLLSYLTHVRNGAAVDGSSGTWTVAAESVADVASAAEKCRRDDEASGIDDDGSVGDDGCATANQWWQFVWAAVSVVSSLWLLLVVVQCGR